MSGSTSIVLWLCSPSSNSDFYLTSHIYLTNGAADSGPDSVTSLLLQPALSYSLQSISGSDVQERQSDWLVYHLCLLEQGLCSKQSETHWPVYRHTT